MLDEMTWQYMQQNSLIFYNMKTHVIFSLYECHISLCFLPSSLRSKKKIRVAKNDYKWKFHTTKMWLILKHIISLGHFNKHKCPISEKCKINYNMFQCINLTCYKIEDVENWFEMNLNCWWPFEFNVNVFFKILSW